MGRTPCCNVEGLKKGAWTEEEDKKLVDYIAKHGEGSWRSFPQKAGLLRCGKSCRLRWANYLKPDIKRGEFSPQEEETIIKLHSELGNKWSTIAKNLPRRTDNEIKNYWNTRLKRRVAEMQIDRNPSKIPEPAEKGNNNAEAENSARKQEPIKDSGKFAGPISTSSKLLNEVAAMLRRSGLLASFMSQQIGKSKSVEDSPVPSPSSAHLLNKMATNLSSSSPKSHSLSAIKAIFSKSLEGDNGGFSAGTASGSTTNDNFGSCNSPVESPQSENAVQVSSPSGTVSASARLLNRMATKLALTQYRSQLVLGDWKTISCNSPDQESTRTKSLAYEPSPNLVGDSPQGLRSHFDGTTPGTCKGGDHQISFDEQDITIEADQDQALILTEIANDDHQKEIKGDVVCEELGSFSNGNDPDEQVSAFTSGSDSYDGCCTPVEAILVSDLEAANNCTDCIYIDEIFNAAIIQ